MNAQLLSICKSASKNYTLVLIQSGWLSHMGFSAGSLIKAVPEDDGINLILCNNHIANYRELLHQTEDEGGKLLTVGYKLDKKRNPVIQLIFGRKLNTGKWEYGNHVVALYEYGIIRVRKIPKAQYHTVGRLTRRGNTIASLTLQFNRLADFGFVPDSLATVAAEYGSITIKLCDKNFEYGKLIKYVNENNLKLIKTGEKYNTPWIGITGEFIANAGFEPDVIFSVDCSHGCLHLKKLNLNSV